ncbi:hypothetical protein M9458_056552, partial [Cirrhinus mrigala]
SRFSGASSDPPEPGLLTPILLVTAPPGKFSSEEGPSSQNGHELAPASRSADL